LSTDEGAEGVAAGGCAGITEKGTYSGYLSSYDSFKIRIMRILATMQGYLNSAPEEYDHLNKVFPASFFDSGLMQSNYDFT
jgi:hypothetical protein